MRTIGFLSALVIVGAAPVLAQGNGRSSDRVPPGHMPPAGMCRIWIDGVPPGRQPAPTDCRTAVARRPANARVIFGGDGRTGRQDQGRYENCDLVGRQQSTVLGLPIPTGRVDEDARRRCEERNRRLDRTRNDGRDDDDDRWDRDDDDSDDRRRPRYERKDDYDRRALEARRDAKDRMLRNEKVKKDKKEKDRKIKTRDRDRDDD